LHHGFQLLTSRKYLVGGKTCDVSRKCRRGREGGPVSREDSRGGEGQPARGRAGVVKALLHSAPVAINVAVEREARPAASGVGRRKKAGGKVRRDGGAPFCLPQPCASTLWLACPSRRLGRNGAGGCCF
jgi:hypothetical protein